MRVVTLERVSKSYRGIEILDSVTLGIAAGERIVLFGPSGSGKTTILRLIAGFLAPDSGTIDICGELVSKEGSILLPTERRNLGMVFQDLALWPHLSVKGNIEFGLKAKGIEKNEREIRIDRVLDMVAMSDYSSRKPAELSGGQQQRIALARALVLEPKIVLMDEPLSSLDEDLNRHMRKELIHLQEKLNFTLLYVTHNRAEAEEIATRIVKVESGKVLA